VHLNDELLLDRRSCARISVASAIIVRPIGGYNHQVRVDDVSTAGCRVELIEDVELGEPVITRFPELEPLVGSVRWKVGATAGLEFSRAMHPAVLDHMVTRLI